MQFSNPGIVIFLLLALIPILIHLFRLRRYKKVSFTRVDLLRKIVQKTGFGNTLKKWWVMLTRILALLFLIIAFAGPYISNSESDSEPLKNCVIFIDNSLSMMGEGPEGICFEAAKNKARELVDEAGSNLHFFLVSHQATVDWKNPLSKDQIKEQIDQLSLSYNAIMGHELFEQLNQFAPPNSNIFWLSDFRKGFVNEAFLDLPGPSQNRTHYFWVIPGIQNHNLSLDTAYFSEPILMPNQPVELFFTVTNHGPEDIEDVPVTLSDINQKALGVATLSIPSRKSISGSLFIQSSQAGPKSVVLSLPGDDLYYDNTLNLHYEISNQSEVLYLYDGNPNPSLEALMQEQSGIHAQIYAYGDAPVKQITQVNTLILEESQRLSSGIRNEAMKLIEMGGNVILLPKPNQIPVSINDLLQELNIAPFYALQPQSVVADSWDPNEPILKGIFKSQPKDIRLPEMREFLSSGATVGERTLWKLKNGEPLVKLVKRGKGNLFVFHASLHAQSGDWAMNPLFVPFILRVMHYKEVVLPLYYSNFVNTTLSLPNLNFQPGSVWKLTGNDIELIPDLFVRNFTTQLQLHDAISSPGFYTLYNPNAEPELTLAFNAPLNQSVTQPEPISALQELADRYGIKLIDNKQQNLGISASSWDSNSYYWRYFLLLALLFLLLEMLLIRWFKFAS